MYVCMYVCMCVQDHIYKTRHINQDTTRQDKEVKIRPMKSTEQMRQKQKLLVQKLCRTCGVGVVVGVGVGVGVGVRVGV